MIALRHAVAMIIALAPSSVHAHPVFGGAGGFYGGLLHPLFVPAHVMAIVACACFTAQQVPDWRWSIHWLSPAGFMIGLLAGMIAIAEAYVPVVSLAAVLALALVSGALLAAAIRLPPALAAALTLATGLALALDSPPDTITLREAIVFQLGTFCGAAILFAAALEVAAKLRRHWQQVGLRIIGSWIAASAILVLALQFR